MEILGAVQCYEWGKLGDSSLVAQLAAANDSAGFTVEPNRSYAELWMGDHVNGPATIKATGQSLTENIRADPVGTIGNTGKAASLPFLLKVLSVRKALSVQVHPDKPEAEKLHRQFPDVYKDPNHKPELAIALTDFQALCGFRPYPEILRLIEEWAPLQTLLGPETLARFRTNPDRQAVQGAYEQLMRSEPAALERCIDAIAERMRQKAPAEGELTELFLHLVTDFGHDVGVLSIFFLNVLRLKPGEAIYLAANVPHAYLAGDCVECMACSDNVVRAGLTPKFKDVETLLRLVSYECGPPAAMLARARLLHEDKQPYTRTFVPPVPDFAVSEIRLPASTSGVYPLDNPDTGSILLVARGSRPATLTTADGQLVAELKRGTVLFLPSSAGRTLQLKFTNDANQDDDDDEPFLAFQAMANGFGPANEP